MRCVISFVGAMVASGVASADPPAGPSVDAFALQIDIGRHGALVDHALDGLGVHLPYVQDARVGIGADADDLWRAIREIGRDGAILKEIACVRGEVGPKRCAAFAAPVWISAPATPAPDLATLRVYEQELGTAMGPFVAAGCAAAIRRDRDPMACSVE